ncbi:MAG: hypothetical protein D5S00_00325 [Tindallia sp. MSAO_Bac2]|nr:MAG: hypothetical protein D5S00_00325 [Tindallia sp. MSAO_Bac2]
MCPERVPVPGTGMESGKQKVESRKEKIVKRGASLKAGTLMLFVLSFSDQHPQGCRLTKFPQP